MVFTKVKGHSDDSHNDAADLLAKDTLADATLDKKWIVNMYNLDCGGGFLKYRIQWKNLNIDNSIKNFIKNREIDNNSIDWALNSDI